MASLIMDNQDGVARSISDAPPTHFTFKIQFFSLLKKNSVERYDSGDFEAGGYKWKLVLYPNGNKSKNVKDHISLYLAMSEVSSLRSGWEVYAVFRMFLLDQNKDTYLTLQDSMGNGRRFRGMKVEWGFDQFISLKAFNDVCNGFLVDDTCMLGAEVFVCKEKGRGKGECLSMIKDAIPYKHSWKIENFSKLDAEFYDSIAFIAGDHKWKIQMYPKGKGNGKGSYVSLYLALADSSTCPPGSKIYADFTLRLLDQSTIYPSTPWTAKVSQWFSPSSPVRGWSRYIAHGNFNPSYKGLLMNDTCWVEADVTVLGVAEAV